MNRIFLCVIFVCFLAKSQSENTYQAFDSISEIIEQISYSQGTKARKLLTTLYNNALQYPDDYILYTKCLYLETSINNVQGFKDSTLTKRITEQLNLSEQQKDIFNHALLRYSLALNYLIQNDYTKSFPLASHALQQFKLLNNDKFISKSLTLLGNICSYIKSHKMAEDYYRQALQYVKPDQITYYLLLENIALSIPLSEDIQPAIDSMENLIEILKKFDNPASLILTYLNIGNYYSAKNKPQQAYKYYEKSLPLFNSVDNSKIAFALYQNLGFYYQNIYQWDNAYKYYKLAEESALRTNDLRALSYAFSGIAIVYENKKKIDSAYIYLRKYNELTNTIINTSKTVEAYQAYISTLLESSQKELQIVKQEVELKNRGLIAAIITFTSIVILVILIFVIIQQKKRRQTIIKEIELAQRLKNEQEIQQLQKEQLESKIREISSYSLLLSSKNNILQQISDLVGQLPNKSKEIAGVCNIIRNNFNAEQDWENFMLHFEKVHPDFFVKLKTYCNNLTENNLRSCAYFRIGLSAKEIAQILNVSPESIKTNRRRLKRKLGLSEKDSLDVFLREL